jgi:hypothetical protein
MPGTGEVQTVARSTTYATVSVPFMFEWYLHTNGYVPGCVGAVNVFCSPPSTSVLNGPFGSEVTECSTVSLLTIVIVAPGDTVSGSPNAIPEIVIVGPAGAAGPPLMATGLLELAPELDAGVLLHPVTTRPIRRRNPSSEPSLAIALPVR